MENRFEHLIQKAVEKTPAGSLIYGYELARTLGFAAQSLSLPLWEMVRSRQSRLRNPEFFKNYGDAFGDLNQLLRQDAENIRQGVYPWTVLKPKSWKETAFLYPKVIWDGFKVASRREGKKAHDFSASSKTYFSEVPEYYRRNFHFQTDGYLSEESADLYEYQVEILFSGAADAMRRLLLPDLRARFGTGSGEGLHFVEVACGTGRLSHFVKMMYPEARITLIDLSDAYLRKAREELRGLKKLDFMQGKAEDVPLRNVSVDAVYSCFLFHELPLEVRHQVLTEGMRLLKPGGFYGFVDSIQRGDKPELDWALEQFPVDFHEPFFKNYSLHKMDEIMGNVGYAEINTRMGFFSKAVSAKKPFA